MKKVEVKTEAGTVPWTGRSGRRYWLTPASPADVQVTDDTICLLAVMADGGESALWTGTAETLISDPASRNLFRAVLPRASAAYVMKAPEDEIDRLTVLWDLDTSSRAAARTAA